MKRTIIATLLLAFLFVGFAQGLTLAEDSFTDTLQEGESKTYEVADRDYEIALLTVGSNDEAKFSVNGEVTDELQAGETDTLSGGERIRANLVFTAYGTAIADSTQFIFGQTDTADVPEGYTDELRVSGSVVDVTGIEYSSTEAKFILNGEVTSALAEGEAHEMSTGEILLFQGFNSQGDAAVRLLADEPTFLGEGRTADLERSGEDHEVVALLIASGEAKYLVNGVVSDALAEEEFHVFSDGTALYQQEIQVSVDPLVAAEFTFTAPYEETEPTPEVQVDFFMGLSNTADPEDVILAIDFYANMQERTVSSSGQTSTLVNVLPEERSKLWEDITLSDFEDEIGVLVYEERVVIVTPTYLSSAQADFVRYMKKVLDGMEFNGREVEYKTYSARQVTSTDYSQLFDDWDETPTQGVSFQMALAPDGSPEDVILAIDLASSLIGEEAQDGGVNVLPVGYSHLWNELAPPDLDGKVTFFIYGEEVVIVLPNPGSSAHFAISEDAKDILEDVDVEYVAITEDLVEWDDPADMFADGFPFGTEPSTPSHVDCGYYDFAESKPDTDADWNDIEVFSCMGERLAQTLETGECHAASASFRGDPALYGTVEQSIYTLNGECVFTERYSQISTGGYTSLNGMSYYCPVYDLIGMETDWTIEEGNEGAGYGEFMVGVTLQAGFGLLPDSCYGSVLQTFYEKQGGTWVLVRSPTIEQDPETPTGEPEGTDEGVWICHGEGDAQTTLFVQPDRVEAHLEHGDRLGRCPPIDDTPECMGCQEDNLCYDIGTRVRQEGTSMYCDLSKQLEPQKAVGAVCENNFECRTNQCSSGTCIDLQRELEEQRGMLERILDWIDRLF